MPVAVWIVVLAGALIVSVGMGVRQTFGLFLPPMAVDLGIGRETFGFALALQQIVWGILQPAMGMIADRYGSGRVIAVGLIGYVVGLLVMGQAAAPWHLDVGAGMLIGFALSGTTFAVVLGAVGRVVEPAKRTLAFGLATAGGSFGQFVMAPVGQQLIGGFGWRDALWIMAVLTALMLPFAAVLRGRTEATAGRREQTIGEALREAAGHSGFWYLNAGFFVCGVQIVFIAVHLPAFVSDYGLPASVGAAALALIGFFNIIGSWGSGVLGDRHSKKYLLSAIYFIRSVVTVLFLYAPKTDAVVLVFASAMGLLWLGTVPLTSGLVAQIFGMRYMATLFGIVFFSHQLGSFLGAWLGGRIFDATGSYDLMWWLSIALGLVAALLHLPIADKPIARTQAA
jgi:predicted MFS family arabinose efflux permease